MKNAGFPNPPAPAHGRAHLPVQSVPVLPSWLPTRPLASAGHRSRRLKTSNPRRRPQAAGRWPKSWAACHGPAKPSTALLSAPEPAPAPATRKPLPTMATSPTRRAGSNACWKKKIRFAFAMTAMLENSIAVSTWFGRDTLGVFGLSFFVCFSVVNFWSDSCALLPAIPPPLPWR